MSDSTSMIPNLRKPLFGELRVGMEMYGYPSMQQSVVVRSIDNDVLTIEWINSAYPPVRTAKIMAKDWDQCYWRIADASTHPVTATAEEGRKP